MLSEFEHLMDEVRRLVSLCCQAEESDMLPEHAIKLTDNLSESLFFCKNFSVVPKAPHNIPVDYRTSVFSSFLKFEKVLMIFKKKQRKNADFAGF